ncbi:MAG: hypothetical protein HYS35_06225 [Betaproteobacteria bacterium]|nr:hypothetical protein [Betaproteobacteria bacterium]
MDDPTNRKRRALLGAAGIALVARLHPASAQDSARKMKVRRSSAGRSPRASCAPG